MDSTLTSKGQITIPKEIRDWLSLKIGQRLDFSVDEAGKLIVTPRNRDVTALRGMLRSPRQRPVSVEEMNAAIRNRFSK
jgi:AbrB family looped-hinge helix DNA binding protein